MGKRLDIIVGQGRFQAEYFNPGSGGFGKEQSGPDDPGVVENQHRSMGEQSRKVRKKIIRNDLLLPYQQFGVVALGQRIFGYRGVR